MKMKRFAGKVALVTGGTYGIGFEVAKRLAGEGAKVMICSRKEENVKAALDQFHKWNLNVHGIPCHVGNAADRTRLIDETIQKYGKLNVLIPNAAVNPTPALTCALDCPESAWDKIFDINVKATYCLAKEALPYLRQTAPDSNIVFVSSIVGVNPVTVTGAYSVSKTSVLGLTKVVGKSLAKEGIRVNSVAPGVTYTPFAKPLIKQVGPEFLAKVPLGRFGQPEEIASVVAFLASNDASYITCETIAAAGGMNQNYYHVPKDFI